VFITEYDDNNGLYVTDRSATGVRCSRQNLHHRQRNIQLPGGSQTRRHRGTTLDKLEVDADMFSAVDVDEGITQAAAAGRGV
jgi:hypothetical protein